MLKTITIGGFKSIRQAKLEFGRVNLFIGGNGSGKSNILEGIGVLSSCLREISDLELQKRGVRLSVPTLFKSAFKETKYRPNFSIKASFDKNVDYDVAIRCGEDSESLQFHSETIKHNKRSYLGRSPRGVKLGGKPYKKDIAPIRGLWDRFRESDDVNIPAELAEELNRMVQFVIYAPQTAFLRGTDVEALPIKPLGLTGGGLPQAARAVLRRKMSAEPTPSDLLSEVFGLVWAPQWAKEIQVAQRDPEQVPSQVRTGDATLYFIDQYMRDGRNKLSAYDSSEGTLYLLFMVVALLHPEAPKIFAVDNIDNSLNPAMTTRMISTVIRATCDPRYKEASVGPDQVFLTSHNPTALDAFDIFDRDQRIFVVARNPGSGVTKVTPLVPQEGWSKADWVKASAGKSLSELWIEGRIKGALGL